MSKQRFVIEGEWSGYRSSQQKVVHREVTTDAALVKKIEGAYAISYTDGTCLVLSVRPCTPREVVKNQKNSYGKLIRDCARYDVWSVDELVKVRGVNS